MSPMIHRRNVIVRTEHGLHLSPCSRVAQTALKFRSQVWLTKGSVRADAKSVLDLMTLAAGPGAELILEVTGDDGPEAVAAILRLFEYDLVSASS